MSSIASNYSSQTISNNAANSSKLQSSSAQSISSIISNSSKKNSITPDNSSKISPLNTSHLIKGPPISLNPFILNYNHRLYISSCLSINIPDNMLAKPSDIIGNLYGLKVCAIQGVDLLTSICIQDHYIITNYVKYDYLCDDTISIQGVTYKFIDKSIKLIDKRDNFSDINIVSNIKSPNDNDSNSICNSQSNNCNYILQFIFYAPINDVGFKSIVHNIIGQIPSGNVYSIDEIEPSEAVFINANNHPLLVTKEYGYSGKTIDDVLKEKGLQLFATK
jgi:hypothetical protein